MSASLGKKYPALNLKSSAVDPFLSRMPYSLIYSLSHIY